MPNLVYEWNPFQQRIDNRITQEVIKTSAVTDRVEFVPRAAPFFSRNFKLFRQGSVDPLILGYDYCFAHSFANFIGGYVQENGTAVPGYNRNVFGSVVMLRPVAGDVLLADYDTIGAGFVLDQVAFAETVANIVNAPRVADWTELDGPTIPTEFPPDPHDHPVAQTYDYEEMMTALKSLILSVTDSVQSVSIKELLEEHLGASLIEAHAATKADFGLPLTPNMRAGVTADLAGNSGNLLVTINLMKTALRQLADGTLNLGGGTAPNPPTEVNISSAVVGSSTVYTVTVKGGVAADGTPVTYTLTQSGTATVIFSKSAGISENEQVTFTAPTLSAAAVLTVSAVSVDSIGTSSSATSGSVTLPKTGDGTGGTGGDSGAITTINTDTTLNGLQAGIIIIDASGGDRSVVLPPSDNALGITDFILRRLDNTGNIVKVSTSGADKIKFHTHLRAAGYPFLVLMGGGDYWHLRSDSAGGWIPVSRYDSTPLGRPIEETTTTFSPGGYGPVSGLVLQRLTWPWLWDHAQQSGMLTTEAARAGMEGGWTQGDGVNSFRGPEIRGRFKRILAEGGPINNGRLAGSTETDMLEYHTHNTPGAGGFGTQMMGGGYNNYSLWVPGVTSGFGGNETRPTNVAYPGRFKMI
jgi:hypothetical protein